RIGSALLKAAGASEEEADAVAVGCVNANLAGHDSHGVIAIPTYIDRITAGHIMPGAKWTIVQESPTTTVIDGHWGFGFHVNTPALDTQQGEIGWLATEPSGQHQNAGPMSCIVAKSNWWAYPTISFAFGSSGVQTASNCQAIESTIGPTNKPIMPCTNVPPSTPINMTGIGVLRPLATSGRNMLSSKFTGTM